MPYSYTKASERALETLEAKRANDLKLLLDFKVNLANLSMAYLTFGQKAETVIFFNHAEDMGGYIDSLITEVFALEKELSALVPFEEVDEDVEDQRQDLADYCNNMRVEN